MWRRNVTSIPLFGIVKGVWVTLIEPNSLKPKLKLSQNYSLRVLGVKLSMLKLTGDLNT
jgi:hypothetical protein